MRNVSFSDRNVAGQFQPLEDPSFLAEWVRGPQSSSSLVTQDPMAQTACLGQIKYISSNTFSPKLMLIKFIHHMDFSFLNRKDHQKKKKIKSTDREKVKCRGVVLQHPPSCHFFQVNLQSQSSPDQVNTYHMAKTEFSLLLYMCMSSHRKEYVSRL